MEEVQRDRWEENEQKRENHLENREKLECISFEPLTGLSKQQGVNNTQRKKNH